MPPHDAFYSLSQQIGWPHTQQEWRAIDAASNVLFAQDANGLYATTTLTSYASMATVGMVLVAPAYRRLGMGTALTKAALRKATAHGAQQVTLTSAVPVQALYTKAGFAPIGSVLVFHRPAAPAETGRSQTVALSDKNLCETLAQTFYEGCPERQRVLSIFLKQGQGLCAIKKDGDKILGFAGSIRRIAKDGNATLAIGPLLAETPALASEMVLALAERTEAGVTCFLYQGLSGETKQTAQRRHALQHSLLAQQFTLKESLPVLSFEGRSVPLYASEQLYSPITLAFG